MNTDKKVFNKLFVEEKVELESQKIELGLTQDAEALLKTLKGLNGVIKVDGDKANALREKVVANGEKALVVFKSSMSVLEKLKQSYDNLGLDAEKDANYKALWDETDTVLLYRKRYGF